MTWTWKGKKIRIIRDLMDALSALKSPEEAKEFMAAYRKIHPVHANQNIGYITGYFDSATCQRLNEWCGVEHPIFGNSYPSAREAFDRGVADGKKARAEQGE